VLSEEGLDLLLPEYELMQAPPSTLGKAMTEEATRI